MIIISGLFILFYNTLYYLKHFKVLKLIYFIVITFPPELITRRNIFCYNIYRQTLFPTVKLRIVTIIILY